MRPSSGTSRISSARRLSQHEFPRQIAFVADLPRTPAGKINRKALRDQEAAAISNLTKQTEQA